VLTVLQRRAGNLIRGDSGFSDKRWRLNLVRFWVRFLDSSLLCGSSAVKKLTLLAGVPSSAGRWILGSSVLHLVPVHGGWIRARPCYENSTGAIYLLLLDDDMSSVGG